MTLPKRIEKAEKRVSQSQAKIYAEMAIKKLLKVPSTAKFSGMRGTSFEAVRFDGNKGYKVTGFLDSQNGFGAIIRSDYSIEIYYIKQIGAIKTRNARVE